jgi:hypothetical protein
MRIGFAAFLAVAMLAYGENQRALDFIHNGWHLAIGSATGSVTELSITRKLGEPVRVSRQKEPNRHDPSATNEIVEMHFDGFDIKLLKTPEKTLVTHVIISGPKILVLEGLRVGTPASNLKVLGDGKLEGGRRCYHGGEGYDENVCFTVSNGAIVRIDWDYEYD